MFFGWCCCLLGTSSLGSAQAGQLPLAASPASIGEVVQPKVTEVWRSETASLPVFGAIRLADFSLPALAVLLGLADGFNPCAMWALVYLLSLLVSLRDRRKIWLLVGNAFLLLGYLRPLTIIIGSGALVIGVVDLRSFILTRGAPVCAVGNPGFKKRTMGRMERLVAAPLTLATFLGVVALAFTVNAIEFACSAGLPAIFTHTLSLLQLSGPQYYGYILLYVLFFMLDDLLIFSLAAFTLQTTMAGGYARYGKLVGGVVLVALGLLMLVAPEQLR
ncbi:MAG: hypothetical protein CVU68_00050 [Deltaproteobacteria bacterium HGW-Deltaproteobacteria-3]|nr:MAG: hypothetical protein CVU68_00050 [Deltaproteobacteria bacterium HGW-Deltaproteobacteria-3]